MQLLTLIKEGTKRNQAIYDLVIALIGLMAAIITAYVIPWIRGKVEADKLARLDYYVHQAVRFANQTIPAEEWERKKEEVTNYLQGVLIKLGANVNEEDLDKIIEGVVNKVKEEAKKVS